MNYLFINDIIILFNCLFSYFFYFSILLLFFFYSNVYVIYIINIIVINIIVIITWLDSHNKTHKISKRTQTLSKNKPNNSK